MSNVHVEMTEDTNGDLVDIKYFHHACSDSESKSWPSPMESDYPVYCHECGKIIKEIWVATSYRG